MHAIQIRNVPDEVYNRLKKASKSHHRTMSGETLAILENSLNQSLSEQESFSRILSVREEIRNLYGTGVSSVDAIREDRDR